MPKPKAFIDYHGPVGAYVALGDHMAVLDKPEALAALGHSGMLIALGRTSQAQEFAERLSSCKNKSEI